MRPFWRNLILQVWGGDPLECPRCQGMMKTMQQRERSSPSRFANHSFGGVYGVSSGTDPVDGSG